VAVFLGLTIKKNLRSGIGSVEGFLRQ